MTSLLLADFFYENWIIIKQLIWLFSKFMDGIMYVLDKMGIYNIALCIVIFTVVTKMILLPLTVKQQKATRMNAYIQPEITAIQKKYKGKTDQLSQQKMIEEQRMVQERYGTSTFAGCLPTLIQMPILFALYPVIYNMEKYVSYLGVLKEKLPVETMDKMYRFLGIELRENPGWKFSVALLIPILVLVTQLLSTKLMSAKQGENKKGSESNMEESLKSMNVIMPIMLGIMAVSFPAFLGVYWIVQNIVMMLQQVIINKIIYKKPIEEVIAENVAKTNAKRKKQGLPPISDKAAISTRNLTLEREEQEKREAAMQQERDAAMKKSEDYYSSRQAKPGSLAAKANMVKDYNERNKK